MTQEVARTFAVTEEEPKYSFYAEKRNICLLLPARSKQKGGIWYILYNKNRHAHVRPKG